MSIDDKAISHTGFTILSNNRTGKMALMVESTNSEEVEQAMSLFGNELWRIKSISISDSARKKLLS